jgi:chromosome segregation ATPase
MKTPSLKEQVARLTAMLEAAHAAKGDADATAELDALRANLRAERQAHAETRKQIAEVVAAPDHDGMLEDANAEIADLKLAAEEDQKTIADLEEEKKSLESELTDKDRDREAAEDRADAAEEYEAKFLIALEMLGMTEHEFSWSKRASDCLMRMPELAHVGGLGQ